VSNLDWNENITTLIGVIKRYERMHTFALVAKTAEEFGEFSEVILFENGQLRGKEDKEFESPFGEAADIINCIIAVLCAQYPDMTTEEINQHLLEAFDRKGAKYVRRLTNA